MTVPIWFSSLENEYTQPAQLRQQTEVVRSPEPGWAAQVTMRRAHTRVVHLAIREDHKFRPTHVIHQYRLAGEPKLQLDVCASSQLRDFILQLGRRGVAEDGQAQGGVCRLSKARTRFSTPLERRTSPKKTIRTGELQAWDGVDTSPDSGREIWIPERCRRAAWSCR